MITLDETRAVALSLPEAGSEEHHGMESFRVRGRIFATVPDDDHVRVMVDGQEIEAAVAEYPDVCAPFWWGARLACVVVTLAAADPGLVGELLTEAWRRKAPKKLAALLDGASGGAPETPRSSRPPSSLG
ncbi:MAG TPA: MmcQ/YjbR family DNA-binding protein [Acidimicrobiales bacterium]|nr:MmcQ/YjbR family DNA-binding protein [Acidimicrobiales bacterium]